MKWQQRQWPWMILKVIHRLQAFFNAIRRTFVQHSTRFQLTVWSHGSSALANVLVELVGIQRRLLQQRGGDGRLLVRWQTAFTKRCTYQCHTNAAAPDSVDEIRCGLYGLVNFQSVKKPIDASLVLLIEALLERDDGSTVYVQLLKRIPPVDDAFREEATPHFQTTSAFYNLGWVASCPCVCVKCELLLIILYTS